MSNPKTSIYSLADRRYRGLVLASTAAALFAGDVGVAWAEQSQPPSSTLEEVIVTARKREENIQNVPVAVTALSAKQLDRYQLDSLEKVSATTPELVVVRGSSGSGADLSLRGVGSSFTSIGIEQSVAVDVDGIYYGQGRVINEALFDMKQVEILKGPQALFFGKNATAGVVSFDSADPTTNFEAMARASYEFSANEPLFQGYVSGPITDRLSARLAVEYEDMLGGYVQNLAGPGTYTTLDIAKGFAATVHDVAAPTRDIPQEKDLVGRLTLKYKITDNLTDTFKATLDQYNVQNATWNSITFSCPGNPLKGVPPGFRQSNASEPCGRNWNTYQANLPPDVAATNFITARHDGHLYQDYYSEAFSNDLKYDGAKFTVDSVTGFHHFVNYFLGNYTFSGDPNSSVYGIERSEYQAFSSELRGQTKFSFPVNFMGGILFQSTRLNFNQYVIFQGGLSDPGLDNNNDYITVQKLSQTKGVTYSPFFQVLWDILPNLNFTAGARYTHETKISYFIQPYVVAPYQGVFRQYDPAIPDTFIGANQTFDNTSPEATLSWKPRSNVTTYVSYKTGYKSGGFSGSALNSAIANTTAAELIFKPETVKGVEGGVKTTLLDGSLRLNVDAYKYIYDNFQVDFFDSVHVDYITKNVGQLDTQGFEAQAEYAPPQAPGLTLNGAFAYNDAFYRSFPRAPCYGGQTIAEGCSQDTSNDSSAGQLTQNLNGAQAGQAPHWTGTFAADYERSLGNGLVFGFSTNAHFSTSYNLSQFDNPFDIQPGYMTLDANVRLGSENGRWQLAVIARNITDREIFTSGLDAPSSGSGTGTAGGIRSDLVGTPLPPRTVAVQLTMRW